MIFMLHGFSYLPPEDNTRYIVPGGDGASNG